MISYTKVIQTWLTEKTPVSLRPNEVTFFVHEGGIYRNDTFLLRSVITGA